jgi:hypothetical protein
MSKMPNKEAGSNITQSERFMKAARELGCDDDPAHFDDVLKKVAQHKPSGGEHSASDTHKDAGDDKPSRKRSS